MINTWCILSETSLSLHNGGHVSICNGSRQSFADENGELITLDKYTLKDAWASPTRKEIMRSLANNIKHENCSDCWIKEEAGFPSMREIHNQNLLIDARLDSQPQVLILKPGNVCNLGCRHCDSSVSNGWYQDDFKLNYNNLDYKIIQSENLNNIIKVEYKCADDLILIYLKQDKKTFLDIDVHYYEQNGYIKVFVKYKLENIKIVN